MLPLALLVATLLDSPPWSPERIADVSVSGAAEQALQSLDSQNFSERQAASAALRSPSFADSEVFVLLSRPELTPEQHERLLCVAQLRILEAPRPALGIQTGQLDRMGTGVTVTGVLRGMPAEGQLLPGDRIVSIDDHSIAHRGDLNRVVQAMRPGDRVRVSVVRTTDGAESQVDVAISLGSHSQMQELGNGQTAPPPSDSSRELLAQQLLEQFVTRPVTLPVERID
jgi:hypothetical protein